MISPVKNYTHRKIIDLDMKIWNQLVRKHTPGYIVAKIRQHINTIPYNPIILFNIEIELKKNYEKFININNK